MRWIEIVSEDQQAVRKASRQQGDALRKYHDTLAAAGEARKAAQATKPGPERQRRFDSAQRRRASAAATYQKATSKAHDATGRALARQ